MVCKCPSDTVSDINGNCVKIYREPAPQCTSSIDCPNTDICRNGNCILACKLEVCGNNAQCVSQNHRATCTCPPNYEGNPYVDCSYKVLMVPVDECYKHEDCPDDRICNNGRCVNPCQNRNACGNGALCYVQSKEIFFYFFLNFYNNLNRLQDIKYSVVVQKDTMEIQKSFVHLLIFQM